MIVMKRIYQILVTLILTLCFVMEVGAQIRGTNITVTVTPSHKDWAYKTSENIDFTVSVMKSGTLLDNVNVSYEMGPDMYPDTRKDVVLKSGTTKITGKMHVPGFYKLKAIAHVAGRDYQAHCIVAVSPEKILPQAQCPKDFDEFWEKTVKDARNTSLESHIEYLPERSTPDVSTYHVSFQNDRWGRRVYGILNVPTKTGKYPAILKVPGAGVRPYGGDEGLCKKGVIVLEIGIHGVPVIKEQAYYDNLYTAALADYWMHGNNNRDRSYYKHVVTGCIRAIDFLEAFGNGDAIQWDCKNLGVCGSSQGGFLTIATTALDKRVSCYAPVHAAMCDHEASLKKVACGWPHMFYQVAKPDMAEVECMRYYDGVNFAKRITVTGWYSFGFNDDVVAPTSMYATYNVAGGEKVISPYQQTGHFWYEEQYKEWFDFLLGKLGIK